MVKYHVLLSLFCGKKVFTAKGQTLDCKLELFDMGKENKTALCKQP